MILRLTATLAGRMRALTAIPALAIAFVACTGSMTSPAEPTQAPTPAGGAGTTTTVGPAPTLAEPPALVVGPGCLSDTPQFVEDGIVASVGRSGGDAGSIMAVSLETRVAATDAGGSSCEELRIHLAADGGAPATRVAPTGVELLRETGIVRFNLPAEVRTTSLSHVVLQGELIDRVYVVRDHDGSLFVDVHLAKAAAARAFAESSPARLVLEVRAGGNPFLTRPILGPDAVLLRPTGLDESYPLEVLGYVRGARSEIPIRLGSPDDGPGEVVVETIPNQWAAIETEFATGPRGLVRLTVGDTETAVVIR